MHNNQYIATNVITNLNINPTARSSVRVITCYSKTIVCTYSSNLSIKNAR